MQQPIAENHRFFPAGFRPLVADNPIHDDSGIPSPSREAFMRIHKIICPKCQTSLTSKAGVEEGTALNCPKCKTRFKVEAPDEEEIVNDFEVIDEEEEEAPPKKVAKPAVKKRPADDDEEEDERPKAKKRSRDDDDRPRKKKKKKRRDDDESAYGKIKGNIWIRVSVLAVLLITLGVVAWMKWGRDKPPTETVVEKVLEDDYSKPITKDQLKKLPPVNPPKQNQPKIDPTGKVDNTPKPKVDPKQGGKTPESEVAAMQGNWTASKHITAGQDTPEGLLDRYDMEVKDSNFLPGDRQTPAFRIKVDPSKPVSEIDLTDIGNKTMVGIYRLRDANTLEVCYALDGAVRPTEFKSEIGSSYICIVWKRKK